MISMRRVTFASILAFGILLLATDTASAKLERGPITGVIGLGEEGHTGGSASGELLSPYGVAVSDANGDIYVVDSGNNRVEIFNESGKYLSQFNGGSEHTFSEPKAVAIDQLNGDVYVTDTGHSVVDKFTANGEYICELSGVGRGCQKNPTEPTSFAGPIGVAVDSTNGPNSGDVYISDKEHKEVDVFTETGNDVAHFVPGARPWSLAVDSEGHLFVALPGEGKIEEYEPGGGGFIHEVRGSARARALGVDPAAGGHVFVGAEEEGEYRIEEFEISNEKATVLGSFGLDLVSAPGTSSPGIAVNPNTKTAYIVDTERNVVDIFEEIAAPAVVKPCSADQVRSTTAMLHDEVNPEGIETEADFRYGPEALFAFETPFSPVDGGAEVKGNFPIEAEASELVAGTAYSCKAVAKNKFGLSEEGPVGSFETTPFPPTVDEPPAFATEVGTAGATLNGEVKPGNGATFYHFAYGTEVGNYTHSLPAVGIGIGFEPISVEQVIPPGTLQPGTEYHFALIATNSAAEVTGVDRTFTTLSVPPRPGAPPVASTGGAESIGQSGATLTGSVTRGGLPTLYKFELGITPSYGTVLFGGQVREEKEGIEQETVPVAQALGNLLPGTTYHYRVVAFNADGESPPGDDQTFTTSTGPAGSPQPGTLPILPTPVFPEVKYLKEKVKKHRVPKGKRHNKKHRTKAKKSRHKK